MTIRTIAIDWSGAATGSAERIWVAEVEGDSVLRLEAGRDRASIGQFLIAEARNSPNLVAGFDFAFSFPAWYLKQRGVADAPGLWDIAAKEGEAWLRECAAPFWGRPGRGRPEIPEHLRRTDREVPAIGGIRPKSVFQIGGAGAVGTGSIRGMPLLKQLREAGFAVWPFDSVRLPLIVEIYPRVLTGAVVKSNEAARRKYLEERHPQLDSAIQEKAVKSEDAFDALVSAFVMARSAEEFTSLAPAADSETFLEGRIWLPAVQSKEPQTERRPFDSSRTRVKPVFNALKVSTNADAQWVKRLLDLVVGGANRSNPWHTQNLSVIEVYQEHRLKPPISLLSWLIRHFEASEAELSGSDETSTERRRLAAKDPAMVSRALERLRSESGDRGWHVLEGATYPDVYIETKDALVVIEGKRTESGPTMGTTWMQLRSQMLRHIDAAWEIRGRRAVYGFFVVEAESGQNPGVPAKWVHASVRTAAPDTVRESLPHRSKEEQEQIAACFLGATTWQAIIEAFALDPTLLSEQ